MRLQGDYVVACSPFCGSDLAPTEKIRSPGCSSPGVLVEKVLRFISSPPRGQIENGPVILGLRDAFWSISSLVLPEGHLLRKRHSAHFSLVEWYKENTDASNQAASAL
jgi:hypothetical protein